MTESTFLRAPQPSASRLSIEALEAGADQVFAMRENAASSPARMVVELSDIRAWRFFEAAPEDFLEQYAGEFVIADVHLVPSFFEHALDYLQSHPGAQLCMRGRFCRRKLLQALDAASARGISVEVKQLSSLRALAVRTVAQEAAAAGSSLGSAPSIVLSEVFCTRSASKENCKNYSISDIYGAGPTAEDNQANRFSAQAWTNFFKQLWFEDLAPALRLRDRSSFFAYMKALAGQTSRGLNWAQIASASSISAPTARDWTKQLEAIGLCELIEPLKAPAPRRAKLRPKLYWTTPGLALWLADSMLSPTEEFAAALVENALFLALKDALPFAKFRHFIDTNYITAPIVAESEGTKTAFFLVRNEKERMHAVKSLKSLAKANIVSAQANVLIYDPRNPSLLQTETLRV